MELSRRRVTSTAGHGRVGRKCSAAAGNHCERGSNARTAAPEARALALAARQVPFDFRSRVIGQ